MKLTQYGLRPDVYYDDNDYPLPIIKSERTLNEYAKYGGIHMGEVSHYYMFLNDKTHKDGTGSKGYSDAVYIPHRVGGMYLDYTDNKECSIANIKRSKGMLMNRRLENDMSIDQLIIEYGYIE